jgi:UDP-N-acetylglucosamine 2-epimerase (non-hydrolysing)
MKKLKVMTIVGTRPEIIRLSETIKKLEVYTEHTLVHTGQNYDYELSEVFFKELQLKKPDHFLEAAVGNSAQTIGAIIQKVDALLETTKPDALLVLGDTNSCLSVIPAKRRKIPIFHMEAGNRCYDDRVPEEINRRIVDHTADINLTYSDIAREYLLREGLPADRIIKTGSPMFEVIHAHMNSINSSDVLTRLNLKPQDYFVVSSHREENIDSEVAFTSLMTALNQISEKYGKRIIFSAHPRTRKKIEDSKIKFNTLIEFMKPLSFFDYNCLQKNSLVALSDSGTISEESSILGFWALNIREAHERPESMEEATCLLTGVNAERILQALELVFLQQKNKVTLRPVADYTIPNVSDKVVRLILSYTDYINRVVWRKY